MNAISKYIQNKELDYCNNQGVMVSVLAIAYNHEKWVARALESLLMQRTKWPIEILVHDDASTDRTPEIIREYEEKYPESIKAKYQTKNQFSQGKYPTDILAEKAIGKYLAFCECDDYWTDPLKLQKQIDLLEIHPECSMAVAKTEVHKFENGRFHHIKTYEGVDKGLIYFDDVYNGCYFHTSTFVIPKNNFKIYSKYREKGFFGDTSVRYILLTIGPFVFLRDIVSVYQITGKGIWTSLDSYAMANAHIKLFENFFNNFNPKYKKYWARNLISNYIHLIFMDIKNLNFDNIYKILPRMLCLGFRYAPFYTVKIISARLIGFMQRKIKDSSGAIFDRI